MSFTTSPNMGLSIPAVGAEPGPQYATDVNNSLTLIDGHTHLPGSGVLITPGAIDINSNLPFNNNFATSVAGLTLTAQTSAPVSNTLYESGVDLFFVDGNGNNVRITQSGGVAGTPGSISNLTSPASAAYVSGSSTFVFQSNTNIAANIDGGSYLFRNLTPNSTYAVTLSAPAALSSSYNLTLPTQPSTTSLMTLTTGGTMAGNVVPDGTTIQINSGVLGLTPSAQQSLVPTGSVLPYAGNSAPSGFLLCDGTSYSTVSYSALFGVIGYAYGSTGGGFNVPDLRGMFLRGVSGTSGRDPDANSRTALQAGGSTGNNVGSAQGYQVQSHTHPLTNAFEQTSAGSFTVQNEGGSLDQFSSATGAAGGNETRPINVYVNYIIKT